MLQLSIYVVRFRHTNHLVRVRITKKYLFWSHLFFLLGIRWDEEKLGVCGQMGRRWTDPTERKRLRENFRKWRQSQGQTEAVKEKQIPVKRFG